MDSEKFFASLGMMVIKPGLERVQELAARAGNPERSLRFIHLAGTNGKGSTGAMLECALRNCGIKTGFYTSPHLVELRERFRVNGRAVDAAEVDAVTEILYNAAGRDLEYSYFEFATVLALLIFQRAGVEAVIWETGMGGRFDATNIVTPEASIITNIALDHQQYLGDTAAKIAAEKAGIIKAGVPVFTGIMPPEALAVIRRTAAESSSPCIEAPEKTPELLRWERDGNGRVQQLFPWRGKTLRLALPGAMQRRNAMIVCAVLEYLAPRWGFPLETALDALRDVRWPGRFQQLEPRLLIDGGHNPDGIAALCEALNELLPGEKVAVVFAAFADKDAAPSVAALARMTSKFYFCSMDADGRDSKTAEELAAVSTQCGVPSVYTATPGEAVELALKEYSGTVLVAGSLYLAGRIFEERAPRAALDLV